MKNLFTVNSVTDGALLLLIFFVILAVLTRTPLWKMAMKVRVPLIIVGLIAGACAIPIYWSFVTFILPYITTLPFWSSVGMYVVSLIAFLTVAIVIAATLQAIHSVYTAIFHRKK